MATSPDLIGAIPKQLFPTRVVYVGGLDYYGINSSGNRFLVLEPARESVPPISVMTNWTSLIEQR